MPAGDSLLHDTSAAAQARDGSSYSPGYCIIGTRYHASSQEPGRAGSRVTFSPTRNDPCKKFRTSGIFRCDRYDKRCSTWWRKNSSLSASLRPPHPPRHSGHLSATRKGQLMKTVQPGQAPASAAGRAHEDVTNAEFAEAPGVITASPITQVDANCITTASSESDK
uniref:Uncharacterized protein n=1 Tax=Branchiostoma floridae TaxID=7739 RepID=C3YKJ1_BRAFL|eukprot:XP_002603224.1 hypothetical protein BRAFLDRAFT_126975 [Branchiostoma floridae]